MDRPVCSSKSVCIFVVEDDPLQVESQLQSIIDYVCGPHSLFWKQIAFIISVSL